MADSMAEKKAMIKNGQMDLLVGNPAICFDDDGGGCDLSGGRFLYRRRVHPPGLSNVLKIIGTAKDG